MGMPAPQPGTTQLDTEPAECTCVPNRGRIWDDNMPKPPAAAGWTESHWRSFAVEMGELVRDVREGKEVPRRQQKQPNGTVVFWYERGDLGLRVRANDPALPPGAPS